MLQAWVRSIAGLWPDGRTRKDVADAADAMVTFIAAPPDHFLRILSQQVNVEPARSPADQAISTNQPLAK